MALCFRALVLLRSMGVLGICGKSFLLVQHLQDSEIPQRVSRSHPVRSRLSLLLNRRTCVGHLLAVKATCGLSEWDVQDSTTSDLLEGVYHEAGHSSLRESSVDACSG